MVELLGLRSRGILARLRGPIGPAPCPGEPSARFFWTGTIAPVDDVLAACRCSLLDVPPKRCTAVGPVAEGPWRSRAHRPPGPGSPRADPPKADSADTRRRRSGRRAAPASPRRERRSRTTARLVELTTESRSVANWSDRRGAARRSAGHAPPRHAAARIATSRLLPQPAQRYPTTLTVESSGHSHTRSSARIMRSYTGSACGSISRKRSVRQGSVSQARRSWRVVSS